METVIEVKPLDNYVIWVLFADNFSTTINIKPFISTGISTRLLDLDYFKQVKIDEFGGISWNNGYDFCPNYLRELSLKQTENNYKNITI
ncbi:MAG: DUF2442 domain-containing protein [Bacteroidota bacterium]